MARAPLRKPAGEQAASASPVAPVDRKKPSGAAFSVTDAEVEGWFRKAIEPADASKDSRWAIPLPAARADFASLMRAIAGTHRRTMQQPRPETAPALRYAGLLLKHLPAECERLDHFVAQIAEEMEPSLRSAAPHVMWEAQAADRLRRAEPVIRDVLAVLEASDPKPRTQKPWRRCASHIAAAARYAWHRSGQPVPASPNADDPLNTIVQLVLARIEGIVRPADSIAAALRSDDYWRLVIPPKQRLAKEGVSRSRKPTKKASDGSGMVPSPQPNGTKPNE